MKITPTSLTVSQLLGSQNEQYVIPAYQRRYSWNRHQVGDLWDDLQVLETSDSHLFGTIVCLAGHHTAGLNRLELVDGQQRLTTISILLHCVLDRLNAANEAGEAQDLARLLEAKAMGGAPQPKIVLESLDAKQFKRHTKGDFGEPANNQRLLQSFELFQEKLAALPLNKVAELLYRLKNQAVIIRLDVSEAKDAFKLFETINNRGLRLSPTDIIKNFILGNAARFGPGALDFARERWSLLLSELDGIALDTFFRQFMIAHLRRRVTKSEVVEEFQSTFMREVQEAASLPERSHYTSADIESDDDDDDEAVIAGNAQPESDDEDEDAPSLGAHQVPFTEFVDALLKHATIYRQLVLASTGSPGLDRRLRNLRLIRAQPSYGFLMALRAGGCNDKRFDEVLRLTEVFMLRRHTTRSRTGENEVVFAQLCSISGRSPVDDVRAVYRGYDPGDDRFRQDFAAQVFPSRLMDRARYCLEQFELERQGEHTELLPGGPDVVHVEHIIPQKIRKRRASNKLGDWLTYLGKDSVKQHPRFVSRIGNLTLFAGELNIGASNNPYHRKKGAYLKSAFKLTQTLPKDYREFRFNQVDARSEELADIALKIWPAM